MAQYTVKFPRLGYTALVKDADTEGEAMGKALKIVLSDLHDDLDELDIHDESEPL